VPLVAGSHIGPYEILAAVGAGGMGEVYRARDTRLERDVALKVLPADAVADDPSASSGSSRAKSRDETARARLLREARLASKLNHPHICTIYDVGEAEPSTDAAGSPSPRARQAVAYIAMELVEGQSLMERLRSGALPVDEVVRYGRQLAEALAHAHARGVVHRDFKSANVVVTPEGQVKVLDFGLAKRLVPEAGDAATQATQALTEAGVVAGTVAYMAPEQLLGRPADARSDLWALGVVLYELLAGERPFQGKTGFALSSAILNQPVPPVPASVPAPLAGVIDRCLAKDPGERFQRADEVGAALEAVASGQAVAAATPIPAPSPLRRARERARLLAVTSGAVVLLAVVGALLFALDAGGLRSRLVGGPATASRLIKLAVLPFANVSGDAEQDYLSDGLTTEMIALLGRLHPETLRVIARTTAMHYRKTDKAVDQIGRELGVDYVLEGSAQREAGRIRITADLIKVADQTQLWAERYEREMAGILALQNDVAQQVAKALALKLLPAEQARLAGAKTVDPEVYDLCLKGKDLLGRFTKADFDAAEQYFQRALAKDPASAVANAGVAGVWLYRRQIGLAPAGEAGQKARAAALKAVELDDSLAEAHLRLAAVLTWTDFDFPGAEREYKRTLDLDPNDPTARALYGHLLMILGRPAEAIPQTERAVAIDPLDVGSRVFHGFVLFFARRYDDALAQARGILRMQPGHPGALSLAVCVLHFKGQYTDAIASQAAYYEAWGWPEVAEALKKGYAESGYAGAWRLATDLELAKHGGEPGVTDDASANYALAGDNARALDLLEKAYAERTPNMPYIGCSPIFDPLRAEPRFQALLRQMNLPQ
jgi:serine/threonine-protein kinase